MDNEFGRQLKVWRKRLKLSQQALSLEADISTKHLSQLETGKASPSKKMVDRICSSLSLSTDDASILLHSAGFAGNELNSTRHEEVKVALKLMANSHEPNPGFICNINLEPKLVTYGAIKLLQWLELDINDFDSSLDLILSEQGLRQYMKNSEKTIEIGFNLARSLLPKDPSNSPFEKSLKQILKNENLKRIWGSCAKSHSNILPAIPLTVEKNGVTLKFSLLISTFGLPRHIQLAEHEYQLDFLYPLDDITRDFMVDLCV